jgi:hypothetical protein
MLNLCSYDVKDYTEVLHLLELLTLVTICCSALNNFAQNFSSGDLK